MLGKRSLPRRRSWACHAFLPRTSAWEAKASVNSLTVTNDQTRCQRKKKSQDEIKFTVVFLRLKLNVLYEGKFASCDMHVHYTVHVTTMMQTNFWLTDVKPRTMCV